LRKDFEIFFTNILHSVKENGFSLQRSLDLLIFFNFLYNYFSPFVVTFDNMASGGLRASSQSTVTNFDAGKNVSNHYFPRHLLYCVLNLTSLAFGGF